MYVTQELSCELRSANRVALFPMRHAPSTWGDPRIRRAIRPTAEGWRVRHFVFRSTQCNVHRAGQAPQAASSTVEGRHHQQRIGPRRAR